MEFRKYFNLIRFDKPIGTWLLFLPCLLGIALVMEEWSVEVFYFTGLFFFGAFLMRSAGCIINDIWDRDFDRNVERTKDRPLVTGIISVKSALVFLIGLLFLAFLVLWQFNLLTIFLGYGSLILVGFYPLMKRITYYPQVFLGLIFNSGVLFASAAILGKITCASFLLYLACVIWTVIYDTIYGYQDVEDDLKIGVKSTSIRFGSNPQKVLYILVGFYWLFLAFCGVIADLNFAYFILACLAAMCLVCQVRGCDFSSREDCLKKFKSNIWVGIIVLVGFILG